MFQSIILCTVSLVVTVLSKFAVVFAGFHTFQLQLLHSNRRQRRLFWVKTEFLCVTKTHHVVMFCTLHVACSCSFAYSSSCSFLNFILWHVTSWRFISFGLVICSFCRFFAWLSTHLSPVPPDTQQCCAAVFSARSKHSHQCTCEYTTSSWQKRWCCGHIAEHTDRANRVPECAVVTFVQSKKRRICKT